MTDIPHDIDDSATPGDCHQADLVSEPKLLPCPFCGTVEMLRPIGASGADGWGFVRCDYCDAEGPDPDNLPGHWNTRADLPRPEDDKRIAALIKAATVISARNKFANPMRSADMHKIDCQCARCHYDALDAALTALKGTPHD
jgi:hypothetical protein